jgi:hypothetical protein
LRIFIPTINRQARQRTAAILEDAQVDYELVVSTNDSAPDLYPPDTLRTMAKGIRETRQTILDFSDDPKVLMLDDDLRFYARLTNGKFVEAEPQQVAAMASAIDTFLDTFAHGGIAAKFMSNTSPRGHVENAKYYHVLAYNKTLMPDPAPTFRTEVGEDHDMNLQLLTRGYPNFVLTEYANDDKERASGGCQTWRTDELELAEAVRLRDFFPDFVTLNGRRPKIAWKRAYAYGEAHRG